MLRNVTSRAAAGRTRASHVLAQSRCRIPKAQNSISGSNESRRAYAAVSDKKRALDSQQLKGTNSSKPKATEAPPPTEASRFAGGESGGSGGGGGGLAAVFALLGATTLAGSAYYNGLFDEYLGDDQKSSVLVKDVLGGSESPKKEPQTKAIEAPQTKAVEAPKKAPKKAAAKTPEASTKADESLAKVAREEVTLSKKEQEEFNEIIADVIGEATAEISGVREVVAAIAEEEKKNAASVKAAAEAAKVVAEKAKAARAKKKAKKKETPTKEAAPAAQEPPVAVAVAVPLAASSIDESKILAEIADLKKQLNQRSDSALGQAHTELAKIGSFDIMGLDIDNMTPSQLKVRLVQMARDLEEGTKWEAVRLQEFLSMKEREVEDRYVLLIKKLRLEAEQLKEEKLAKQRKILTSQAEEALKGQQTKSNVFLENSMQIQEKAHAEDKATFEQTTKAAMDAKYEELLGHELTKIKEDFATKMNQRVNQMEVLTKKLTELEFSLKSSKDFQVGSLEAHRITAAAIALMEKLESGDPAGAAVRALEAVASSNAVVSSAVKSLPSSVSLSGVASIQELQAAFDETIYPQCRKAANIPPGVNGLEGQLLGSVFSFLRPPPGSQEAAPESEKDASEYVLARIKRYVQLGELGPAITEAKKLEGQVAYTAKDWAAQAMDRVAVEKALKVIRMECALANENLAQA